MLFVPVYYRLCYSPVSVRNVIAYCYRSGRDFWTRQERNDDGFWNDTHKYSWSIRPVGSVLETHNAIGAKRVSNMKEADEAFRYAYLDGYVVDNARVSRFFKAFPTFTSLNAQWESAIKNIKENMEYEPSTYVLIKTRNYNKLINVRWTRAIKNGYIKVGRYFRNACAEVDLNFKYVTRYGIIYEYDVSVGPDRSVVDLGAFDIHEGWIYQEMGNQRYDYSNDDLLPSGWKGLSMEEFARAVCLRIFA